jgi:hypothetical protein
MRIFANARTLAIPPLQKKLARLGSFQNMTLVESLNREKNALTTKTDE